MKDPKWDFTRGKEPEAAFSMASHRIYLELMAVINKHRAPQTLPQGDFYWALAMTAANLFYHAPSFAAGQAAFTELLAQAVTKMQAAAAKLPQTQVTDGQAR